jgi:hypothetical protein
MYLLGEISLKQKAFFNISVRLIREISTVSVPLRHSSVNARVFAFVLRAPVAKRLRSNISVQVPAYLCQRFFAAAQNDGHGAAASTHWPAPRVLGGTNGW